jgi:hypothetical protein
MLTDELLTYLFDEKPHSLAAPMSAWLTSSRRYAAFINTHHTKIRKKLRTAQEPESLRDLQLELETAYLLLREKSLNVAYEPQHRDLGRSPDFAVTFTTSLEFMVEVTRLRSAQQRALPETGSTAPLLGERFTDMLCDKLGQLLPQRSNLLLVGSETPRLNQIDMNDTMLRIQKRAESNETTLIQRNGFRDRADFFRHYGRLSALLVRGTHMQAGEPPVMWVNSQAKYPFPTKVLTAISRSHIL